jgi:hypothetical protein
VYKGSAAREIQLLYARNIHRSFLSCICNFAPTGTFSTTGWALVPRLASAATGSGAAARHG